MSIYNHKEDHFDGQLNYDKRIITSPQLLYKLRNDITNVSNNIHNTNSSIRRIIDDNSNISKAGNELSFNKLISIKAKISETRALYNLCNSKMRKLKNADNVSALLSNPEHQLHSKSVLQSMNINQTVWDGTTYKIVLLHSLETKLLLKLVFTAFSHYASG